MTQPARCHHSFSDPYPQPPTPPHPCRYCGTTYQEAKAAMTDSRTYALADVLTLTTGRLLSPRRIEAVYDLANWMTRDNLMTHQLPRAAEACGPALLTQHPQLDGVESPNDIDIPDLMAWLANAERVHGTELPVTPLPVGVWEYRNPIEELCDMVGPERVIVAPLPVADEEQR